MLIEIVGWVGVIILALSGLPQIFKTFKVKHVEGVSFGMIFCWFSGCSLMLFYTLIDKAKMVLIINYLWSTSTTLILLILYFLYKKR
jgi:uncharacterized protein with PQ loop repeat